MQEQLLERLRERLGERAPQSLRFRVGDDSQVTSIYAVICRAFCALQPAFRGPNWYPYVNLHSTPTLVRQSAGGRGFL